MRLTELCKFEVVTESGKYLGHVVDLRCAGEPEHGEIRNYRIVSELIFGKAGWLEHLGFRAIEQRRVPWQAVRAINDRQIVIADEAVKDA